MATNLVSHLEALESLGLIRRTPSSPEPAYEFRHVLVQDAAYASLLRQDRKWLHQAVGELLERTYPEQRGELAPVLAGHFHQAGDDERALRYYVMAGDLAARRYALPEAETYYTSAIDISQAGVRPSADLYRARGGVYETRGEHERAQLDYESALRLAQASSDRHVEWQTLLDLGFLWAGRDYAQTHEYYQRALDLARAMGDAGTIAQSLNRIGNWHANVEQPAQALDCHKQALATFQALNDQPGIAATLDLLGQTSIFYGDLLSAYDYYDQAIRLYGSLGDRRGQIEGLNSRSACHTFLVYGAPLSPGTLADDLRDAQRALDLAREIGWRPGEVVAVCTTGACYGAQGRFTPALERLQAGLALAGEIGHRQWMVLAETMLGGTYLDLLALPEAQQHLERARSMADEIRSLYWARLTAALLAQVYVLQHDMDRAAQVLDAAPDPAAPPETLAQSIAWYVRAELALACGNPALTLEIAGKLAERHANAAFPILQVAWLRGEGLIALRHYAEAVQELKPALDIVLAMGAQSTAWRLQLLLAQAYTGLARMEDAQQAIARARSILHDITDHTPVSLRANLLSVGDSLLP